MSKEMRRVEEAIREAAQEFLHCHWPALRSSIVTNVVWTIEVDDGTRHDPKVILLSTTSTRPWYTLALLESHGTGERIRLEKLLKNISIPDPEPIDEREDEDDE